MCHGTELKRYTVILLAKEERSQVGHLACLQLLYMYCDTVSLVP